MASTVSENNAVYQESKDVATADLNFANRRGKVINENSRTITGERDSVLTLRKESKRVENNGEAIERCDLKSDGFFVKYRNRNYDIREFLKYHPGGRGRLCSFKNRSLDKAFEENPHSRSAFHLFEDYALDEQRTKDEKHETLVDWNTPILWQVGTLTDRYWDWVNLPVNRSVCLFQSRFLEQLTITPWYFIPIVWLPVCLYFIYAGCSKINYSIKGDAVMSITLSFALGVLLWTVLEYLLHRKLFHFRPPKDSKTLITLHFLLHGIHHKAPLDDRRLLFPPVVGLVIAKILWEIYVLIFPQSMVYFIAAGTATGYLCYDLMHYYLHYGAPKVGTYLYTMKRSHNYHHYLHHDKGFGISSRLWDFVFGTDICLRHLTKPIEW